MTFRDEAVAAYWAGRHAAVGDANPYAGVSLVLAKLWRRAYQKMLWERSEATSAMQEYRRAAAPAQRVNNFPGVRKVPHRQ